MAGTMRVKYAAKLWDLTERNKIRDKDYYNKIVGGNASKNDMEIAL